MSPQENEGTLNDTATEAGSPVTEEAPTVTLREVPRLCPSPLMRGADPGPPANDAEDTPSQAQPSPRNGKVRDMRGSDPHTYDQLGLLRQPSGTEPPAEHRRRIDTNEATLTSQLLRIKDGMAAEAQKQDEQHTLVLTAIVDVQDTLTAIREAPPSAVTPASWGSLNELAAMFNRSMDTMEALTRAVADSTASMTTMHARLTAVEARLKIPPVQEVITPAATRSTREEGVLVAQYISHSQCPTACLRSSISQYPTTYLHSGSNPCYGRRTSKLCPFPHHCGACRSRGSAQHPLGPDLLPTGHYICCLWVPRLTHRLPSLP